MPYVKTPAEEPWTRWAAERPRLVRLCARLTGDSGAAEDLTQETLLEAWRHCHGLREPERFPQWLSGVARNVCLRWMRQQGRGLARVSALPDEPDDLPLGMVDGGEQDSATSLEVALERQELAALLDRALDLLAPETRVALLAHYVEQVPLAQIGLRMGLRPTAVAMRLRRGKLALRRVLSSELGEELAAFKPDAPSAAAWEETSLWCPLCGKRHLQGRYDREAGELWLRCLGCRTDPHDDHSIHTHSRAILGGVKGYKRAYDRVCAWADQFYRPHLHASAVPCPNCGRMVALERVVPSTTTPAWAGTDGRGLRHDCPVCARECWESFDHLLLSTPEARTFMRQQGRMRMLPPYEVETQGRTALVSRFESVVGASQLALISDAQTFELLRADGVGALAGAVDEWRPQ